MSSSKIFKKSLEKPKAIRTLAEFTEELNRQLKEAGIPEVVTMAQPTKATQQTSYQAVFLNKADINKK